MTDEQNKTLTAEVHAAFLVILHDNPSLNLLIHRIREKNREFNTHYADLMQADFFQDICKRHIMNTTGLPQEWYDSTRYL